MKEIEQEVRAIEQKFFETFKIEPKQACFVNCKPEIIKCEHCQYIKHIGEYTNRCTKMVYPEITDRILLELMEILLKQELQEFYYEDDMYLFTSKLKGVKRITCNKCTNLKELILHTAYTLGQFIPLKDRLTKPIQSLFAEEE